ncbi:hypothetical protein HPB50_005955 [Hyalomma asiaticum]|uniref:Uncharacterized protein n=1 Tax=Hyalomma asiaticum TaxID=266040 RepID=A0ACB7RM83_HYAAI|nr:hypothetical protein HPB50_005955 [Hyalomma asiaticum]
MTDKDLTTLCSHLARLSAGELCALESSRLLPPLRPRTPRNIHQDTVSELRRLLEAIRSRDERLQRVASIYCWLIFHNRLPSWFLYRIDPSAVDTTGYHLHKRAEAFINKSSSRTKLVCMSNLSGRFATVMSTDPDSRQQDQHSVIVMYVWNQLPYMAVCISGMLSVENFGLLSTHVLNRDHEDLLVGFYADFNGAFAAACSDVLRVRGRKRPPGQ